MLQHSPFHRYLPACCGSHRCLASAPNFLNDSAIAAGLDGNRRILAAQCAADHSHRQNQKVSPTSKCPLTESVSAAWALTKFLDVHLQLHSDGQPEALCSVEGISVTSVVVETLCYTVIIGYNINHYYAISTYGDVFACWLQNLVICGLLAWYRRPTRLQLTSVAIAFAAFNWWIISGYCGMHALVAMQVWLLSTCECKSPCSHIAR